MARLCFVYLIPQWKLFASAGTYLHLLRLIAVGQADRLDCGMLKVADGLQTMYVDSPSIPCPDTNYSYLA